MLLDKRMMMMTTETMTIMRERSKTQLETEVFLSELGYYDAGSGLYRTGAENFA